MITMFHSDFMSFKEQYEGRLATGYPRFFSFNNALTTALEQYNIDPTASQIISVYNALRKEKNDPIVARFIIQLDETSKRNYRNGNFPALGNVDLGLNIAFVINRNNIDINMGDDLLGNNPSQTEITGFYEAYQSLYRALFLLEEKELLDNSSYLATLTDATTFLSLFSLLDNVNLLNRANLNNIINFVKVNGAGSDHFNIKTCLAQLESVNDLTQDVLNEHIPHAHLVENRLAV